jgi:putative ABC transport system ATP-binding protein
MAGLDLPTSGRVVLAGSDLNKLDEDGRAALRAQRVGFVFQSFQLLLGLTALENVMLPLELAGQAEPERIARDVLGRVDLAARARHYPSQLSGGEQQRVAIARALVAGPDLVLADEPTGNLDPSTGRRVFELLRDLQRERRFALVLATHSERLARGCDRVLRLADGRLRPLDEAETRRYFDGLGA